jgi:hypothetical protein
MVTKIFQDPKKIVEEQVASYTSSLNSLFSICLSATESKKDSMPKVLTIIVVHPKMDLL